jgi:ATP-dependent Clp protease adapter protein ClpS
MFSLAYVFVLALAPVQLAAFTPQVARSSQRITSKSAASMSFPLELTASALDVTTLVDNELSLCKTHKRHKFSESDYDDTSERWELKLFNDSINTRSYICRCLVDVAEQSEEQSYLTMKRAHEQGESTIQEYCCQEHAEHYKEALEERGLNCGIFVIGD